MKPFDPAYFQSFKEAILSHNLKSGEIIIEIWNHEKAKHQFQQVFEEFLVIANLKLDPPNSTELNPISQSEALESIKYGMSTKANYTSIERAFSGAESNKYAQSFLGFFDDPLFYTISAKIYQSNLDLEDFWESGGAIVIDNSKIGLFWLNDLYDFIKQE